MFETEADALPHQDGRSHGVNGESAAASLMRPQTSTATSERDPSLPSNHSALLIVDAANEAAEMPLGARSSQEVETSALVSVAPAKAESDDKGQLEELSGDDDEAIMGSSGGGGGGGGGGAGKGALPVSADEKAKANRDRNREHARNTRLRKKAYVEQLKQTVQELSAEREAVERDRRIVETRTMEQTVVRRQVLQTMFYYRAIGQTDRDKWATLLDESFTFIQPVAPYRSFDASEVVNNQRVVAGIDGMIADTASLAVMLQSIGRRNQRGSKEVRARYYSGPEDMICEGESLMCRWMMKTENAVECGALCECYKQGMLKARYTNQNKLVQLDFVFDVMVFMQQMQRACGCGDFQVIPNTPAMATQQSVEARGA
jgi:hypothetical protein